MIQVKEKTFTNHHCNGHSNEKVYTSKSAPLVEKIRKRFFDEEWPKNRDLYCEQDIERIRQSEWFVKRFLLASNRNVNEAYVMLKIALQWRKKYNLSNIQGNSFPKEFYEIGGLFCYEPDREGNPVIYLRIRMHKKIKELHEPVQQFLFYMIDRADQQSNSNGCVVVFDCDGAGYSNMDLDLLRSLIDVAFKYFPFCIRYVIVYELSWMLNAFRKIAMTFVPASFVNIVRFANKNNITNFIAIENLPDFMGGTCQRNYREIPEGCQTVFDMAHEHGFKMEDAERIMIQFEPLLKEGREAIEARRIKMMEYLNVKNNSVDIEEDNNEEDRKETLKNELLDDTMTAATSTTKSIAIVHSPASKSFSQIASIYPQNVIHFKLILNPDSNPEKENFIMTATIMVRNNHQSKSLAFKIQSNCSDQYMVTPSRGVLLSGAFISIRITGKNPVVINQNEIQDKFLILMSLSVDPQVHLKNSSEFNKIFLQGANQVFVHKLTTLMSNDNGCSKKILKKMTIPMLNEEQTRTKMEILINELKILKKKYDQLERQQMWLIILLIILLLVILILICLNYLI